jgi:hypothetical protein
VFGNAVMLLNAGGTRATLEIDSSVPGASPFAIAVVDDPDAAGIRLTLAAMSQRNVAAGNYNFFFKITTFGAGGVLEAFNNPSRDAACLIVESFTP